MGQISSSTGDDSGAQPASSASVLDLITSTRAGDLGASAGVGVMQQAAGDIGAWQDQLVRQTRIMQRVANITYEEFLRNVKQLNDISCHYLDDNGKQLVFAVKKGSDSTILWKATVRIACVKVDASTKEIDSYKTLNLKQFLLLFHRLKNQADAVVGIDDADCHKISQTANELLESHSLESGTTPSTPPDECVICLERKPELILPCAHSYCLPCIEQWNVDHKTCPVCRETLASTEDGWVVSDGPDCTEIATEIQKSLLSLTQ